MAWSTTIRFNDAEEALIKRVIEQTEDSEFRNINMSAFVRKCVVSYCKEQQETIDIIDAMAHDFGED